MKLDKEPRAIGSECQLYSDEVGNKYIKYRYVDKSDKTISHSYFKRVVISDDGNFELAIGAIRAEGVKLD